jgi:hypothetical protein
MTVLATKECYNSNLAEYSLSKGMVEADVYRITARAFDYLERESKSYIEEGNGLVTKHLEFWDKYRPTYERLLAGDLPSLSSKELDAWRNKPSSRLALRLCHAAFGQESQVRDRFAESVSSVSDGAIPDGAIAKPSVGPTVKVPRLARLDIVQKFCPLYLRVTQLEESKSQEVEPSLGPIQNWVGRWNGLVNTVSSWWERERELNARIGRQVMSLIDRGPSESEVRFVLPALGKDKQERQVSFSLRHPRVVGGVLNLPGLTHGGLIATSLEFLEMGLGTLGAHHASEANLPGRQSVNELVGYWVGNITASVSGLFIIRAATGTADACNCGVSHVFSSFNETRIPQEKIKDDKKALFSIRFGSFGLKVSSELRPIEPKRSKDVEVKSQNEERSFREKCVSFVKSLKGPLVHLALHKIAESPGVALGVAVATACGVSAGLGAAVGNFTASLIFHLTFEVY